MKTRIYKHSPSLSAYSYESEGVDLYFRTSNLSALKLLYESSPEKINHKEKKVKPTQLGWTPLFRSVVYGALDVAKYLLETGADPNIANSLGETPLHQSADMGLLDLTALLLEHKADPNQTQTDGSTPLHNAVRKNHIQVVQQLLNSGADPNIQESLVIVTQFGKTALHLACDIHSEEIFQMLVKFGGDVNLQDLTGKWAEMIWTVDGSDDSSEDPPAKTQAVYGVGSYKDTDLLYSWLRVHRLEEMFPVLVKFGFHSVDEVVKGNITERELIDMKVRKSGLRFRFLYKVEEEAKGEIVSRNGKRLPEMNEWLENMNMTDVARALHENGFYFTDDLLMMNSKKKLPEELGRIGVSDKNIFKLGVRLCRLESECTDKSFEFVQKIYDKGSLFDCGFCSVFKSMFN